MAMIKNIKSILEELKEFEGTDYGADSLEMCQIVDYDREMVISEEDIDLNDDNAKYIANVGSGIIIKLPNHEYVEYDTIGIVFDKNLNIFISEDGKVWDLSWKTYIETGDPETEEFWDKLYDPNLAANLTDWFNDKSLPIYEN